MGSILKDSTKMLSVCVAAMYGGFLVYKFYTTHPEEKKKESSTNHLPLEIFGEILPYMDVKDLWRCKSVCKQWNTLIQSRYFANKYAMHKSTTYSCGNFFEKDCSVWIKKYVVGLATCDGLELQMEITNQRSLVPSLILSPKWKYSFFVTNITICQSLPIPRPFSSVETCQTKNFGFVVIPSTLEYKVVCFYTDEKNKKILRSDYTWRR